MFSGLTAQDNAILIEAENAVELGDDIVTMTEGDMTFLTSLNDFAGPGISPFLNEKLIT